jgi:hypothetical protein
VKKSELLKEAKKYLWDGKGSRLESGKDRYICYAISDASDRIGCWRTSVEHELINWIDKLLGRRAVYLEDWLQEFHPDFPRHDSRKMQQLRKKWLNWMIKYWQERGE